MPAPRPRLLDLFCGAGGAAMGYHRAGFDVVGVDINPQPHYPFEFHQTDAMTYALDGYDAIHASPPCQAYSTVTRHAGRHPDLYEACRSRLQATGVPWAIENVIGAPYGWGVELCGAMFGLETPDEWLRRHRNFELSHLAFQPPHRHRSDVRAVTVTGHCFLTVTKDCARHSRQPTFALAQELMGIDWMTRRELTQAVPPAYTEWIGAQLLAVLSSGAHEYGRTSPRDAPGSDALGAPFGEGRGVLGGPAQAGRQR